VRERERAVREEGDGVPLLEEEEGMGEQRGDRTLYLRV
jgi:hypothetical protein